MPRTLSKRADAIQGNGEEVRGDCQGSPTGPQASMNIVTILEAPDDLSATALR